MRAVIGLSFYILKGLTWTALYEAMLASSSYLSRGYANTTHLAHGQTIGGQILALTEVFLVVHRKAVPYNLDNRIFGL